MIWLYILNIDSQPSTGGTDAKVLNINILLHRPLTSEMANMHLKKKKKR